MRDGNSSRDPAPLKILVDTNVWLDYFLARSDCHQKVTDFVTQAWELESVVLVAVSLSLKDVAYLLASDLKRQARAAGCTITPEVSAAAREAAWGCVRSITELALVAPISQTEVFQAFTYKGVHDDFEDDLILAAAQRSAADCLLTHDAELAHRSPLRCVDVDEALALIADHERTAGEPHA